MDHVINNSEKHPDTWLLSKEIWMQTIEGCIRKVPRQEKLGNDKKLKLFIGNINFFAASFAELDKIISKFGPYTALRIHYERPKCYAFVSFDTEEVAGATKASLDGYMFHERALTCHYEVPP